MFLLCVNDLQNVSNICNFVLVADDTTVLFHDKSVDILNVKIEREMTLIAKWFTDNRLALNLKKTYIMPFYIRKQSILVPVYIANVLIPCVTYTKFLGMLLDSQLNWNVHINFICNKLSQCVYILRLCADYVPINVRIQIRFAFAQPYIMYGIECRGNATVTNLNKVFVLQKRLIR